MPTVFGELEVVTLVWVTKAQLAAFDATMKHGGHDGAFPAKEFVQGLRNDDWAGPGKNAEKEASPEAEEEKQEYSRETGQEESAKLKPSSNNASHAPLKFKDAVGRKFSFPWHLVKTWKVSHPVSVGAPQSVPIIPH